jgi:hypothetical protein
VCKPVFAKDSRFRKGRWLVRIVLCAGRSRIFMDARIVSVLKRSPERGGWLVGQSHEQLLALATVLWARRVLYSIPVWRSYLGSGPQWPRPLDEFVPNFGDGDRATGFLFALLRLDCRFQHCEHGVAVPVGKLVVYSRERFNCSM